MIDFDKFYIVDKSFTDKTIILGEIKPVKLSFIVTTYNRFELLKRCVESILNQKGIEDYQIIISDNNYFTINDYYKNPKNMIIIKIQK